MNWFRRFLHRLVIDERSPHKVTLSFCMGTYIAFSPYLALHTLMVFIFSWFFRLNLAVTLASAYFINNPWTLVPVYLSDYIFGYWLVHKVWKLNVAPLNEMLLKVLSGINNFVETKIGISSLIDFTWIDYVNRFFEVKLGLPHPCIWSFLIGGNLLGIIFGVISYPLMKPLFSRIISEYNSLKLNTAP